MQGASEYAKLFGIGQHGRLFLVSGSHARGRTFQIFVLPDGVKLEEGTPYPPADLGAVEVYGVTSGQPGWTETYGWLHEGRWQQDFEKLVEQRKAALAERDAERERAAKARDEQEAARRAALLAAY